MVSAYVRVIVKRSAQVLERQYVSAAGPRCVALHLPAHRRRCTQDEILSVGEPPIATCEAIVSD